MFIDVILPVILLISIIILGYIIFSDSEKRTKKHIEKINEAKKLVETTLKACEEQIRKEGFFSVIIEGKHPYEYKLYYYPDAYGQINIRVPLFGRDLITNQIVGIVSKEKMQEAITSMIAGVDENGRLLFHQLIADDVYKE